MPYYPGRWLDNLGMAEWAVCVGKDLVLRSLVFADLAHPKGVREYRSTGHDASGELGVAVGANCGPVVGGSGG